MYKIYDKECESRLLNSLSNCPTHETCNSQNLTLKEIIFIELKGEDLDKAVDQIKATYEYLSGINRDYKTCKSKKAYAVTTRCPSKTSELDKIKRDLKKNTGIIFDRLKPNSEITI